jgi:hypothetical protein
MEAAGLLAGVRYVDGTWVFVEEPPPGPGRGVEVSDRVHHRADVCADAWAYRIAVETRVYCADPYQAISSFVWSHATGYSWAWWLCRLVDGDTAESVASRALNQ